MLQRTVLEQQLRVVVEVLVQEGTLESEEAAAYPTGGEGGFLVELGHLGARGRDPHLAVPAAGVHPGDCAKPPTRHVRVDKSRKVDGADAVTVGQQKSVTVEIVGHSPDPRARAGEQAGFGESNLPVLVARLVVKSGSVLVAQPQGEVRNLLPVVQEVALDLVALVAEAQHEPAKPKVTVDLHNVPQDRAAADIDQGLRQPITRLSQPGSHPAAQDDDLHVAELRAHTLPAAGVALGHDEMPFTTGRFSHDLWRRNRNDEAATEPTVLGLSLIHI